MCVHTMLTTFYHNMNHYACNYWASGQVFISKIHAPFNAGLISRRNEAIQISPGLKGLVKEMHCCPSDTEPDTSETSLVQVPPVVVSTVSGHAPDPPRHYIIL